MSIDRLLRDLDKADEQKWKLLNKRVGPMTRREAVWFRMESEARKREKEKIAGIRCRLRQALGKGASRSLLKEAK